jgi:uncharacterized protein YdeI (YjbR/CyaY-like superfamily)
VPVFERNPLPRIPLRSREQLRAWLAQNHADHKGFWLVSSRPGPDIPYDELVEECLIWGWIDSTVQTFDEQTHGIRLTPRKPNSVWSALNKARLAQLEEQGLMQPAGQRAVDVAKANGMYTFLDEVDALVIPDDLGAALGADLAVFSEFPPGKQRQALYWIKSAKRPQTRADRIAKVAQAARSRTSIF